MIQDRNGRGRAETGDLARAILASSAHLIIATDPGGLVTLFNGAAEEALGYASDDIVGRHAPTLWHDPTEIVQRASELSEELGETIEPGFEVIVTRARHHGSENGEWTFHRKDGTTFPADLTVTCIRDASGQLSGYLGVIKDLSATRAAEAQARRAHEEIAEAKAFLDLINQNNPDLVFVKDQQFRIVNANPAFLNVYPPEMRDSVIGYTTIEKYTAEEADEFLKMDREAFETGSSEVLERIAFPDGKTRLLSTKKVRFENSRGEAFILGIARDVTERENLIRKLKETNDELEEFAYRTSHDLRSPLVSAIRLLSVVHEAKAAGDAELEHISLSHIEASLTRLEALVKDILSLAQTKGAEETPQLIDFDQLISTSVEKLSHLDHFERMDIRVDLHFDAPVLLEASRMTLIVENLISNAIKYQDLKEDQPFLHITTSREGHHFVLRMRDNGLGVPERHQHKLFKMFQRFHSRTSFGSGLGLYMVKKSAEIIGGKLSYTDPGKGACFELAIPVARTQAGG